MSFNHRDGESLYDYRDRAGSGVDLLLAGQRQGP